VTRHLVRTSLSLFDPTLAKSLQVLVEGCLDQPFSGLAMSVVSG
jgi:hypothetical protein